MAEDKKFLNLKQLQMYHSKVDTKMKTKVTKTLTGNYGDTNTIDNSPGQEGCVMCSELTDAKVCYATNTSDGATGILAQIYAINPETATTDPKKGARLNITKSGMFYTNGQTSAAYTADDEIATMRDIKSIVVGTFRGSFATKADLDAYTGDKVKNDYASVDKDETRSNVSDMYIYNGTAWTFGYILEDKSGYLKLQGTEEVSGLPYNLPYFFFQTPTADNIKVTAMTIPLDNTFGPDGKKVVTNYDLTVPGAVANSSATATDGTAGLMTAADKYKLDNMGGVEVLEVTLTNVTEGDNELMLGNFTADQVTKLKEYKYPVRFIVNYGSVEYFRYVSTTYTHGIVSTAEENNIFFKIDIPAATDFAEGGAVLGYTHLSAAYLDTPKVIGTESYNCIVYMNDFEFQLTFKSSDTSELEYSNLSPTHLNLYNGLEGSKEEAAHFKYNGAEFQVGSRTISLVASDLGTGSEPDVCLGIDDSTGVKRILTEGNWGTCATLDGYVIKSATRELKATDDLMTAVAILEARVKALEDSPLARYDDGNLLTMTKPTEGQLVSVASTEMEIEGTTESTFTGDIQVTYESEMSGFQTTQTVSVVSGAFGQNITIPEESLAGNAYIHIKHGWRTQTITIERSDDTTLNITSPVDGDDFPMESATMTVDGTTETGFTGNIKLVYTSDLGTEHTETIPVTAGVISHTFSLPDESEACEATVEIIHGTASYLITITRSEP